ncbi:hypothetical protein PATSB16_07010 [Pandoraea thiooxydans]|nr:hypothetical protein PATSB16_07010 [Pandoraea thiooxydans]
MTRGPDHRRVLATGRRTSSGSSQGRAASVCIVTLRGDDRVALWQTRCRISRLRYVANLTSEQTRSSVVGSPKYRTTGKMPATHDRPARHAIV